MKIKFDTATMTEAEARGLSAMLAAMFPDAEDAEPKYVQMVGRAHRPARIQIREVVDVSDRFETVTAERIDFAPDGYPVATVAGQVAGTPERDTAGIPWDERIHASTKTTNKDGTWTRRRNTPDEVFDKVMAELKAANTAMTLEAAAGLTAPATTPEPPAAPSAAPTAAEAFTPPASVVIPPHVPAPPVPVAVPQPPAPPQALNTPSLSPAEALNARLPDAYDAVSDKSAEAVEIMKAVNAKQVPQDKLAEIMAAAGLKGLGEVFTAPIETRRVVAAALAAL